MKPKRSEVYFGEHSAINPIWDRARKLRKRYFCMLGEDTVWRTKITSDPSFICRVSELEEDHPIGTSTT